MAQLTDLQAFVRVATSGSFTRAAEELGVPKSTVSRRVSRLEDALGVELIHRGPRVFRLTERGELLRNRAVGPLHELAEIQRAVADVDPAPAGLLRVAAPADFGKTMTFARILTDFRRTWPAVTLEVDLSNRVVDLIAEGFDVAVRMHAGPLPDSSALKARRVVGLRGGLYASPSYLEARGRPRTLADLANHDCISPAVIGPSWELERRRDGERVRVPIEPVFVASDFSLGLSAVIAGGGIGYLPEIEVLEALGSDAIVRLLPSWRGAPGTMSLVWPVARHPSPRVRAFLDHFTEQMRAALASRDGA